MKPVLATIVAIPFFLCVLLVFADDDSQPKSASLQREQCAVYMAGKPNNPKEAVRWTACAAYARAIKDEMDGEMIWADDAHKNVIIGTWQNGVNWDQTVRVFFQYVEANPSELNKPARDVIRESAEKAGIYKYSAPTP